MDFHKIIYLWTMFGFNFKFDTVIEDVFGDEGEWMIDHLKIKLHTAYKYAGSYGCLFYFWSELDTPHKKKLEAWVMDNYKG